MIASQILWSDQGILSFAPEGEAKYGRKNFMELLSVFTSPPLFQVICGQEGTRVRPRIHVLQQAKQAVSPAARRSILEDDPSGLAASNRPRRAIGREGQVPMAGSRGSSSATRSVNPSGRYWQATKRSRTGPAEPPARWLNCVRNSPGFAPVRLHSSSIRMPNCRWWTFAGGVANTILGHQLKRYGETQSDNLSIRIEGNTLARRRCGSILGSLRPEGILPVPDPDAIQNLKFSEALPRALADEVFCSRFDNPTAIRTLLAEPIRIVTDPQQGSQQS